MKRSSKLNHPPDANAYGTERIPTPDRALRPLKHVLKKEEVPVLTVVAVAVAAAAAIGWSSAFDSFSLSNNKGIVSK